MVRKYLSWFSHTGGEDCGGTFDTFLKDIVKTWITSQPNEPLTKDMPKTQSIRTLILATKFL